MVSVSFAAVCCLAFNSATSHQRRTPTTILSMSTTNNNKSNSDNTPQRAATLRSISSTISSATTSDISERASGMNQRAAAGTPLTTHELGDVVNSINNIRPADHDIPLDEDELQSILKEVAHLSHKDWAVTGDNAKRLGAALLKDGVSANSRQMLERILLEGNWDGAAKHAAAVDRPPLSAVQPWAVLVTGVNGIRKTTSIYQPWFSCLLKEALVAPKGAATTATDFDESVLPVGSNSFFRQLDHMIATLCNEDFAQLYLLTQQLLKDANNEVDNQNPPLPAIVKKYSDLKAAIFTRYRTLSELLGALLLAEAQVLKSNCMMETSGRDVAMFHYIDHFFPTGYNKLALHFTINDLTHAQTSVDARMVREIQTGIRAIEKKDTYDVIYANAGGPYGSDVLAGVQEASDRVWNEEVMSGNVGQDWYKATISINAHATEPWTAQAVLPDGSLGTKFPFEPLK